MKTTATDGDERTNECSFDDDFHFMFYILFRLASWTSINAFFSIQYNYNSNQKIQTFNR